MTPFEEDTKWGGLEVRGRGRGWGRCVYLVSTLLVEDLLSLAENGLVSNHCKVEGLCGGVLINIFFLFFVFNFRQLSWDSNDLYSKDPKKGEV